MFSVVMSFFEVSSQDARWMFGLKVNDVGEGGRDLSLARIQNCCQWSRPRPVVIWAEIFPTKHQISARARPKTILQPKCQPAQAPPRNMTTENWHKQGSLISALKPEDPLAEVVTSSALTP